MFSVFKQSKPQYLNLFNLQSYTTAVFLISLVANHNWPKCTQSLKFQQPYLHQFLQPPTKATLLQSSLVSITSWHYSKTYTPKKWTKGREGGRVYWKLKLKKRARLNWGRSLITSLFQDTSQMAVNYLCCYWPGKAIRSQWFIFMSQCKVFYSPMLCYYPLLPYHQ